MMMNVLFYILLSPNPIKRNRSSKTPLPNAICVNRQNPLSKHSRNTTLLYRHSAKSSGFTIHQKCTVVREHTKSERVHQNWLN